MGLLAYALYKKAIQEARIAGRDVPLSGGRNPSDAEQRAYRSLATEMLDLFGQPAQESAKESILDGGFRPELSSLRTDVFAHIDRRTSWRSAFLVNLAAWIASIGLTVLFAVGLSAPGWIPKVKQIFGIQ